MRLNTKRFIITILIASFFIYSIVIYTIGTRVDKGEKWVTVQSKKREVALSGKKLHCLPSDLWFGRIHGSRFDECYFCSRERPFIRKSTTSIWIGAYAKLSPNTN